MAKKKAGDDSEVTSTSSSSTNILRAPAEELFAEEIEALIANDKHEKPASWRMSPRAVLTYICGGKAGNKEITPKYIGAPRLVEIAISTLVTDRALLLIGEPGTAKSWLSEHLAAAIHGDSTKVVVDRERSQRWSLDSQSRLPRHGIGKYRSLRRNHSLCFGSSRRNDLAPERKTLIDSRTF
jgi:hypothetical protein